MPKPRLVTLVATSVLLGACASAPHSTSPAFPTERPLQTVKAERHLTVTRFVDSVALAQAHSVSLPSVSFAPQASDAAISTEQTALVANRAARDLCTRLARNFVLSEDPQKADLRIDLQLMAIVPTGRGSAGASAVLGVFVPGPFRLPAGLGGLAMDAAIRSAGGEDVLIERWSRGANAVMDDARVSTIGDAYQLAGSYARELAAVLVEPSPGQKRSVLDRETIRSGRRLCTENFGSANMAGRGASLLLPLAPEAIDSGKPEPVRDDERSGRPDQL